MSTKASKNVSTPLLGVVAGLAAPFVLAGCDEPVETRAYETVEQCVDAQVYTEDFCSKGFEEAATAHTNSAPRYEKPEDCAEDFGAEGCKAVTSDKEGANGGTSFIPFMYGYMIGSHNSADNTTARNFSQPVYRSAASGPVALSGAKLSENIFNPGGAKVSAGAFNAPKTAQIVKAGHSISARGGFGSSGRAFSMGG